MLETIANFVLENYGIGTLIACVFVCGKYKDVVERVSRLEQRYEEIGGKIAQMAADVAWIRGNIEGKEKSNA